MKVSNMEVTYLDGMGNDLSVVNAARVSFDKMSEDLTFRDVNLIAYLAEHDHWSPFAHTSISLRIKAPLFVARQLGKHQVGLVWNEVSRRYVDSEPEFYIPDIWRKRSKSVKQGSADEPAFSKSDSVWIEESIQQQLETYTKLLTSGVCPEQARMVLPQCTMTEWIWTGSLLAFVRVCRLRCDEHTQRETQEIAFAIKEILGKHFPISTRALLETT